MEYRIEQVSSQHLHLYNNIKPSDLGLWVYIIDGRAYGFTVTENGARDKAQKALGVYS